MERIAEDGSNNNRRGSHGEETRKLQYTGGSSYIVSLPKKWIQELGLKQGDHVVILRQGDSTLQIAPASRRAAKEQKEATIEVTKDHHPYYIARKLIALYFLGYNTINVVPKDGGWSYFAGRLEEYCKNGRVEDRAMYKELGNETRKVIVVDAPPQAVFKALSDEKELTQWFPSQARMEARVGGAIEFQFVRPDGQNHMLYGRVLELVPDEKLSYTWNFAHRDQLQETVTWTLEPVGGNSNKTRVTLVHAGFEKPSQKDVESGYSYEAGWTHFIGRLEELFKKKRK